MMLINDVNQDVLTSVDFTDNSFFGFFGFLSMWMIIQVLLPRRRVRMLCSAVSGARAIDDGGPLLRTGGSEPTGNIASGRIVFWDVFFGFGIHSEFPAVSLLPVFFLFLFACFVAFLLLCIFSFSASLVSCFSAFFALLPCFPAYLFLLFCFAASLFFCSSLLLLLLLSFLTVSAFLLMDG